MGWKISTNREAIDGYVRADQRASDHDLPAAERVAALKSRAAWSRELSAQERAIAQRQARS